MVGMAVKSKICELEEDVKEGSSRSTRNELTGVLLVISGKKRFLVRFQDGCKNNLSLNQLTIFILDNIPEEKEPEAPASTEIPDELVELDKGYYCRV